MWDVETGYHQATLAWYDSPTSSNLMFSSDGHTLAIGDQSGIRLWDTTYNPYKVRWTVNTTALSFTISPDGQTLASGKKDGTITLWDAISGTEKTTLIGHIDYVGAGSIAFSPDGRTLASTGWHQDTTIRLWDIATASHRATLVGHTERITGLEFSSDGRLLVSASRDGTILIWEYPLPQYTIGAPMRPLTHVETSVLQNYPNPFNPETWIPYQLSESAEVIVSIYAADGKLVRTLELGQRAAGIYESRDRAAYWDGRNAIGEPVGSGVYFYTLSAGKFSAIRKMVIRK